MLSTSQSTQALDSRNSLSSRRSGGFLGGIFDRDIGDSTKKAKDIGTLSRSRSYSRSGDVGGKDLDFFKFKLDGSTQITAKLKNTDKDNDPIALTILKNNGNAAKGSDGKFLFQNVQSGKSKQLTARLAAGTYFVRLQSDKGSNQNYDLDLTADSSSSGSSSGGSSSGGGINFNNARNIGRLQSGTTYRESGNVGGDDVDVYRFDTQGTNRILADLTNNGNDDVAFRLVNTSGETVKTGNGNFLFANVRSDDSDSLLAPTLGAGTYYFVIQSSVGRNEDYSFKLKQSSTSVTPI
jgi:hypothetical protein